MSCWVVPTLAAEFWSISLEQVLLRIREGTVTTKVEHGFTFVDVVPEARESVARPENRSVDTPLTYVPITREELAALTEGLDEPPEADRPDPPALGSAAWVEVRHQAAQRRRGPQRQAA